MTPSLHWGALSIYGRWSIQVPSSHCWVFQQRSSPLRACHIPSLWHCLEVPPRHIPRKCIFPFTHLALQCLFPPHFSPLPLPSHPDSSSSLIVFFSFLSEIKASLLGPSFLLNFLWSKGYIMGILYILANTHLSVSTSIHILLSLSYLIQDDVF